MTTESSGDHVRLGGGISMHGVGAGGNERAESLRDRHSAVEHSSECYRHNHPSHPRPEDQEPASDIGRTSGAAVVTGGLWSIARADAAAGPAARALVVAARFLGPDGMGRQSLIAFVGLTTVMLATAGFPSSVARFVGELLGARRGGQALGLYVWTWRIETVAAVVAGAGLAAVGLLGSEPRLAWVLVGVRERARGAAVGPAGAAERRPALARGDDGRRSSPASPPSRAIVVLAAGRRHLRAVRRRARGASRSTWPGWPPGARARARGCRRASRSRPSCAAASRLRRDHTINVFVHYVVWTRSELLVLDHVLDRRADRPLLDRVRHRWPGSRACPRRSRA